jgi:TIR domain/Pentapeptide repeats (8 copies)
MGRVGDEPPRGDLSSADLSDANLVGATLWNLNIHSARLRGADARNADLRSSNFRGADLSGADLRNAALNGAELERANLRNANLSGARLYQVDCTQADFTGAVLSSSDLRGVVFNSTVLEGVDLTSATLGGTVFADVDLKGINNLTTCQHVAPSTIGIDTLYRSGGKLSEVFLRKAGIPETLIAYARSLTEHPFNFYSCFISYSAKDNLFCERLYADLQAKTVRVWRFPENAIWGESMWGEIDQGIKSYDKLVVVCSENSLHSLPVLREMERALQREEREGRNILFPVRIDDYIFEKWEHPRKSDVVAKVIGDFRGWDRDAAKYRESFERVLKTLQSATTEKPRTESQ